MKYKREVHLISIIFVYILPFKKKLYKLVTNVSATKHCMQMKTKTVIAIKVE